MTSTPAEVISANRLIDGAVVYLTRDGRWSDAFDDAFASADPRVLKNFQTAADAAVQDRLIVGPYVFPVEHDDTVGLRPVSQREWIRSLGPTVGTDLRETNLLA